MSFDPTYDEQQLLRQMAAGDEAAFTELYNRYWEQLFVMAWRRVQSQEDAKEIVQNVFFQLWQKRNSRELVQNLPVYLAGMVRFMVYRHLDNLRRRDRLTQGYADSGRGSGTDPADIDNKQLLELLTQLTNTLPEKYRLIFLHHKLLDRPLDEVAQQLGISPRTAERYVGRLMGLLRENRHRLSCTLLML
ncbi:MAG: sigma-70 family RNA polymerase sigma factor [Candidatus Pseudobacter hemicellulosilyticus]|uniref:Sigma-70 family RNA polymerase sigma factor n=1 Tax=Candidatus Pseudobacter hemicellulosilyticus TaxID=3121375 RepID=A0AAJ6BG80_9BACT|nr:MAG: sigma-70 family RNA polymerase sigma factor [Pseudobacter sp.]